MKKARLTLTRSHAGFLGFCLCAGQLCAQEQALRPEAPPWGAAVLMGRETGDSAKSYGNNYGAEVTWQFLRDHWVQGRLRGSIIKVEKGTPDPWVTPLQANFLVFSCDWIFRPMKAHGPYLLLGAGGNYHQVENYYIYGSSTTKGHMIAMAWGVGWLIKNQVEIELRQDALMVDFLYDNQGALCTSLVLRKRF